MKLLNVGCGKIRPGMRFGRWTVITRHGRMWRCRCDCGTVRLVSHTTFPYGRSKSCGCLKLELFIARSTKHGGASRAKKSPEYKAWRNAMDRCFNKNDQDYQRYGGRGITVCNRWRSAANFLADVPKKPRGKYSLGRIDNDDDYKPGNVAWQTDAEQARNRSTNRFVSIRGRRLCLFDAARLYRKPYDLVRRRLNRGWTPEKALTTPKL